MLHRKGPQTSERLEAEYPFAVDIPIPGTGLRQHLKEIEEAARLVEGEQWACSGSDEDGNPYRWCRIGVKDQRDAERLLRMFAGLGAKRGR